MRAGTGVTRERNLQRLTNNKRVGVYLGEYQLRPFDRLTEIMRDLFACESFSEGTLANFKADCSRRLEPVEDDEAAAEDLGHLPQHPSS